MVYFGYLIHFGHKNIASPKLSTWESGFRDFDSVEQMDSTILANINKYVAQEDILYFLGDFCFGGHIRTPLYRERIICKTIHLCKGNHDEKIDLYKNCFTSIQDVLTVKHGKHTFFLSHYSHRTWIGQGRGYLHLWGHSHNTLKPFGKSMDVGVDVAKSLIGEYRPFSIEEVISILDKREIEIVDHHNSKTNIR